MTHPNRVQPDGTFLATEAKGTLMGNRGILHDASGHPLPRRWAHRSWVACELSFRGRKRELRKAGRYTELFFLDEAVAIAAGHRPCGECRDADYRSFSIAWTRAFGDWPGPRMADRRMHAARAIPGARLLRHTSVDAADLPDGAIFRHDGADYLRWAGAAHRYGPTGYARREPLPRGPVVALTNPVTMSVLTEGYRPRLHPSVSAR